MKIAIFHNLPSGGAKRSLYEWIQRLRERHHLDLYVYSSASEDYLDIRPFVRETFVYGNDIPKSTGYSLFKKALLLYKLDAASRRMAGDIDAAGYDLVFVNHCTHIQSPQLLRYLKTPSLYFCQEPFRRVYEPRSWRTDSLNVFLKDLFLRMTDVGLKRLDSRNARSAGLVLANSRYSARMINVAYGVDAKVNYLGVDVTRFVPKPDIQKKKEVISVGRLKTIKGHDFIIKSLGLVDAKLRPALKIIADSSDADYQSYLVHLSQRCGVSCSFQEVAGEEMPDTYNRAMLSLFAPIKEPLGLVSIESMACGVPVVGVKEGGIPETIKDGETGILSERDPDVFSRAVTALMKDDEKRRRMGEAGVAHVRQHWSWEKSTEELEKNMYHLVKQSNRL